MAASLALLALTAASAVHAAVTPTAPGPGDVFQAGGVCRYSYTPDTTGTWRNVSIDLMTGSNFDMQLVQNIASNLDGTAAGRASGSGQFTCPEVTVNAAVYFLQFTNNGGDPTWTTRFTIASSSGQTQAAPSSTTAAGTTIGYGYGSLVGGAAASGAGGARSGAAAATSTADAVTVTATDSSYSPPSSASATSGASASDDSSSPSSASDDVTPSFSAAASSGRSATSNAAAASGTRSASSSTGSGTSGAGKVGVTTTSVAALLGIGALAAFVF